MKFDVVVCFGWCLALQQWGWWDSPMSAGHGLWSPLGGQFPCLLWHGWGSHRFIHKVLCVLCPAQALFEWYFIWQLIGVQYRHFLYNYHAISEQTFFSSNIKNVIEEYANLENCPIIVAFTHNSSRFLKHLVHFGLYCIICIININLTLQNPSECTSCFAGYCDQRFSKDCAWNYIRSSVWPRPRLLSKHWAHQWENSSILV